MPVLQVNRLKSSVPLEYHSRLGLITREAEYRCIEIILGPFQLSLGVRAKISEYDHDHKPASR